MTTSEPEVLDVGCARLAHPEPAEFEEDRESSVIVVKCLCTKEAPSECEAVEPAPFGAVHRRAADAFGRVRHHRAVDVRNRE